MCLLQIFFFIVLKFDFFLSENCVCVFFCLFAKIGILWEFFFMCLKFFFDRIKINLFMSLLVRPCQCFFIPRKKKFHLPLESRALSFRLSMFYRKTNTLCVVLFVSSFSLTQSRTLNTQSQRWTMKDERRTIYSEKKNERERGKGEEKIDEKKTTKNIHKQSHDHHHNHHSTTTITYKSGWF